MKIAKCPDGTRLAFDDDTPQSTIDEAVKRYLLATKPSDPHINITTPEPVVHITVPEQPAPIVNIPPSNLSEAIDPLLEDIKRLTKAVNSLENSIRINSIALQKTISNASKAVVSQMSGSSDQIQQASSILYAALTKDKTFEFDSSGLPVRLKIDKGS